MGLVPIVITIALALPGCTINLNTDGAQKPPEPLAPVAQPVERAEEQPAPIQYPEDSPDRMVQRFFEAGWHYCDAVVLSGLWEGGPWDAKVRVGSQIASNHVHLAEQALSEARKSARAGQGQRCPFRHAYTPEDADALAKAWGISRNEAKVRAEDKILWGDYALIDEAIARGKQMSGAPAVEPDPDTRALRAFLESSDLDLCHAKMLSAAWGSTVSQAKVILGHKLVHGHTELQQEAMAEARSHARANLAARCQWSDTSFSFADATQIAKLWDMTVEEAKAALTDKYLHGTESSVRSFLASQTPGM